MPSTNPQAMGNLYDDPNYAVGGAAGGTFAPAHIAGDPRSQAAVAAWQAPRGMNALKGVDLQSLQMPDMWQAPQADPNTGMRQSAIPGSMTFGVGATDQSALRAMAQNTPYDVDARRNAIAERVAQNTAAQEAYNKQVAAQPAQQQQMSDEDMIRKVTEAQNLRWYSDVNG